MLNVMTFDKFLLVGKSHKGGGSRSLILSKGTDCFTFEGQPDHTRYDFIEITGFSRITITPMAKSHRTLLEKAK